ncbi:MAG: Slp family lipoprotein [Nitrospirota bacterium]|nr:Slp family lipoprotein [Nitrospirota bacterium]
MRSFIFPCVMVCILLAGCGSALSPELTSTADTNLTFALLRAEPDAHNGKTVILGGVIAELRNLKIGTEIEIVQKDLDFWGRPRRTDRTGGRFLVRHRAYLDAMIYSPGREITVGGTVSSAEREMPVITAKEMRLWDRSRPAAGDPSWIDPLSDRAVR